jgi:5-methyltetrahydrofolate--homocysteine methyltransferase
MTTLTAPNGAVHFGADRPTLLINDQLRVMDQSPRVLEELHQGRFDTLLELARRGRAAGMQAADLLLVHHELDEVELLPRLAVQVLAETGCPVSLDTRNPAALEAALAALRPYKALLNSVSAEPEVMESLLPIAARYGAAVVGIPIGEGYGIPETVEGRLAGVQVILAAAAACGIPRQDVVIDAICLASAVAGDSLRVTLETLREVNAMGLTTILGIGNAGHGMPTQTVIDLAYLIAAIPWGLHAALVDPATAGLQATVLAADFLTNRDPYGARYIAHYRAQRKKQIE